MSLDAAFADTLDRLETLAGELARLVDNDRPMAVDATEAARLLSVSPRHIQDLVARGVLPRVVGTSALRISRRAIERLVDGDTLAARSTTPPSWPNSQTRTVASTG